MKKRAGIGHDILIVDDVGRNGFVHTFNSTVHNKPGYEYYVYTAQDALAGRYWLKIAHERIRQVDCGVFAFNTGWFPGGDIAQFGMISKGWIDNFGYDCTIDGMPTRLPFFPGYHTHYADMELSVVAKAKQKYVYDPRAVLAEVDYHKEGKPENAEDINLYRRRYTSRFDGRI